MIYRRKKYKVNPQIVKEFNRHFKQTLLPAQLKYGARLVGRWMTTEKENEVEIMAIWEYDSLEEYEKIEAEVRGDQEHVARVQEWYKKMGGKENLKDVFYQINQDFLESTLY